MHRSYTAGLAHPYPTSFSGRSGQGMVLGHAPSLKGGQVRGTLGPLPSLHLALWILRGPRQLGETAPCGRDNAECGAIIWLMHADLLAPHGCRNGNRSSPTFAGSRWGMHLFAPQVTGLLC